MRFSPQYMSSNAGFLTNGSGSFLLQELGPVELQTAQEEGLWADKEWDDDGFWGEGEPIYDGLDEPAAPAAEFSATAKTWKGIVTNGWQLFLAASDGTIEVYGYDGTLQNTYAIASGICSLATDYNFFYVGFDSGLIAQYTLGWEHVQDIVTLPDGVYGMYWSEDVLWATGDSNQIYEVDVPDKTYVGQAYTGVACTGIAVLADVLLCTEGDGSIYALHRNTIAGAALWTQATGISVLEDFAYDEMNSRLWYLKQDGSVSSAEVSTAGEEPWA